MANVRDAIKNALTDSQRAIDAAEIKIKLIENGILVKIGPGWYTFDTWARASEYIKHRIDALVAERLKTK